MDARNLLYDVGDKVVAIEFTDCNGRTRPQAGGLMVESVTHIGGTCPHTRVAARLPFGVEPDNASGIAMAGLNATADRHAALARKGICTHGWLQTRPVVKCKDCGRVFDSIEAAYAAADEYLD